MLNPDGGLPQVINQDTDQPSISVVSGRALNAFPIMIRLLGDSSTANYTATLAKLERFLISQVEGRYWFTGQHPDLFPSDYEQDSTWEAAEYWITKYQATNNSAYLSRGLADIHFVLLMLSPKDLPWVTNPTQLAACEQEEYVQYSVYTYHNKKWKVLYLASQITNSTFLSTLANRVLQNNLFTQAIKGQDIAGGFYEAIADPWLGRGGGYNWMGTVYMAELSLDLFLQFIEVGIKPTSTQVCFP